MPLPSLQSNGFLPVGLHLAEVGEIKERFGQHTPQRQYLFERVQTFLELASYVTAKRMFVNGSYVTSKEDPGDVDIVIWLDDNFLRMLDADDEKALRLEDIFLTRQPQEAFAVFDEQGWNDWLDFFSRVRYQEDVRKGLVEVKLQ